MPRRIVDEVRGWTGKQDRYWYMYTYSVEYLLSDGSASDVFRPPPQTVTLGTVTRVADTKSPHFNRWFAVLHNRGKEIKSEPLLSKEAAKAWLEVIERMNRG